VVLYQDIVPLRLKLPNIKLQCLGFRILCWLVGGICRSYWSSSRQWVKFVDLSRSGFQLLMPFSANSYLGKLYVSRGRALALFWVQVLHIYTSH